jgi:hypothetical protein
MGSSVAATVQIRESNVPLEVTYWNPNFPDGKVFSVVGLGSFKNGETVELSAEQERRFLEITGRRVREGLGDDFVVSGTSSIKVG